MPNLGEQIQQTASDKQAGRKPKKKGRFKGFFKGVWSELKKVHWPTKKQLITYTGVVIVAVLLMSLAISLFDFLLSKPIEWGLSL